jgi:hypothetical protein
MMITYRPQAGSVAAKACAFFSGNPDEELAVTDIADKFGCGFASVHTLLRPALEARLLMRRKDELGSWLYGAGAELAKAPVVDLGGASSSAGSDGVDMDAVHSRRATAPASQVLKPGTKPRAGGVRVHLDIASLQVEDGVPFIPPGKGGAQGKWDALFDKLAKVGQSLAVPGEVKAALAAAAMKRNKATPARGKFAVQKTGPDAARVWRVA